MYSSNPHSHLDKTFVRHDISYKLRMQSHGEESDLQLRFDFSDISVEDQALAVIAYYPFAIGYHYEKDSYVVLYGKETKANTGKDNCGILLFAGNGILEEHSDITDVEGNLLYTFDEKLEFSFYSKNTDGSYNIVFR